MRKLAFLFVLLPVGLAFLFLGGFLAPPGDRIFHPAELLLSESSQLCQEGKLDACENALKNFILQEPGSPKLRSVAFYNLGTLSLEKAGNGDPIAAKDAVFYFKEALRNDPLLFPAKYNLELLLRSSPSKDDQEGQGQASSPGNQPSGEDEKEKMKRGLTAKPPHLGTNP
jgi:hypothetical protein